MPMQKRVLTNKSFFADVSHVRNVAIETGQGDAALGALLADAQEAGKDRSSE